MGAVNSSNVERYGISAIIGDELKKQGFEILDFALEQDISKTYTYFLFNKQLESGNIVFLDKFGGELLTIKISEIMY